MTSHSVRHGARSYTGPCQSQNGNALFLILFAFVLFVALAYAVMHTFRAREDSNRDVNFKSGVAVTQYSSAIRTGVTRMLLRDVPLHVLDFSIPSDKTATPDQAARMVFNAAGGGVTYTPVPEIVVQTVQQAPADFNAHRNGNWHFVMVRIGNIGTNQQELVALLYDVKKQFCEDINYQITGNSVVPVIRAASSEILKGNVSLTGPAIDGQPFLCIRSNDANIYYHVLAEQ